MPLALRSFVRQLVCMLVVWSAAGCHKLGDDDCQLSNTCRGTLLETLRREAPDGCAACLEEHCSKAVADCTEQYRCNRAARCQVKADPISYQDCLSELWDDGLSSAGDWRGAWEGDTRLLRTCLTKDPCLTRCQRHTSDWSCIERGGGPYDTPMEIPLTLVFSVKFFGLSEQEKFQAASNVEVHVCRSMGCNDAGPATRSDGTVELVLPERTPTAGLHFELVDGDEEPRFPRTYYYPGRLGESERQPIAVYLIPSELVRGANESLIDRFEVLADAGQSVILPDACREQNTPSATGVTLRLQVGGVSVPRCVADAGVREDGSSPACVWYAASGGTPDLDSGSTVGWGGGVVGLPSGRYTLSVCHGDDLVSRRTDVKMSEGALTIARTWPLTAKEKGEADQEGANPCAAQLSSSSIGSDASAN
jgi:hypothetical protein